MSQHLQRDCNAVSTYSVKFSATVLLYYLTLAVFGSGPMPNVVRTMHSAFWKLHETKSFTILPKIFVKAYRNAMAIKIAFRLASCR